VAPDELLGFAEIIETLGVSRRTAHKYVSRTDFPSPVEHLARGRLWLRADVEAWARQNLPLRRGRPPKSL
jgi:prophage regulatory protein